MVVAPFTVRTRSTWTIVARSAHSTWLVGRQRRQRHRAEGAVFDAAVARVDGLVRVDVVVAGRFDGGEGFDDVRVQRAAVGLEREHVVGVGRRGWPA
jgi:hypothetical protein